MRVRSESASLGRLAEIREGFRSEIQSYELKARPCDVCPTRGTCCTDEHFVNVIVGRLEAKALRLAVKALPSDKRSEVMHRAAAAAAKLSSDESPSGSYSCPLFDAAEGCLVHLTAKPLPCIAHACYDSPEDLPPDEHLASAEARALRLDQETYRTVDAPVPIPYALLQG